MTVHRTIEVTGPMRNLEPYYHLHCSCGHVTVTYYSLGAPTRCERA